MNSSLQMTPEEKEFFVSVSLMSRQDRKDLYRMLKQEEGSTAKRKRTIFKAAVRAAKKLRGSR
jgi:hypothetical protein